MYNVEQLYLVKVTTIIIFEGSSCQLHEVVINLIIVKYYEGSEILTSLQPNKLDCHNFTDAEGRQDSWVRNEG